MLVDHMKKKYPVILTTKPNENSSREPDRSWLLSGITTLLHPVELRKKTFDV